MWAGQKTPGEARVVGVKRKRTIAPALQSSSPPPALLATRRSRSTTMSLPKASSSQAPTNMTSTQGTGSVLPSSDTLAVHEDAVRLTPVPHIPNRRFPADVPTRSVSLPSHFNAPDSPFYAQAQARKAQAFIPIIDRRPYPPALPSSPPKHTYTSRPSWELPPLSYHRLQSHATNPQSHTTRPVYSLSNRLSGSESNQSFFRPPATQPAPSSHPRTTLRRPVPSSPHVPPLIAPLGPFSSLAPPTEHVSRPTSQEGSIRRSHMNTTKRPSTKPETPDKNTPADKDLAGKTSDVEGGAREGSKWDTLSGDNFEGRASDGEGREHAARESIDLETEIRTRRSVPNANDYLLRPHSSIMQITIPHTSFPTRDTEEEPQARLMEWRSGVRGVVDAADAADVEGDEIATPLVAPVLHDPIPSTRVDMQDMSDTEEYDAASPDSDYHPVDLVALGRASFRPRLTDPENTPSPSMTLATLESSDYSQQVAEKPQGQFHIPPLRFPSLSASSSTSPVHTHRSPRYIKQLNDSDPPSTGAGSTHDDMEMKKIDVSSASPSPTTQYLIVSTEMEDMLSKETSGDTQSRTLSASNKIRRKGITPVTRNPARSTLTTKTTPAAAVRHTFEALNSYHAILKELKDDGNAAWAVNGKGRFENTFDSLIQCCEVDEYDDLKENLIFMVLRDLCRKETVFRTMTLYLYERYQNRWSERLPDP